MNDNVDAPKPERRYPKPHQVLVQLQKMLAPLPAAGCPGSIRVCTINGQHFKVRKAVYQEKQLRELLERADVVVMQETNATAAAAISEILDRYYAVSHRTPGRDQANAIFYDTRRVEFIEKTVYHDYVQSLHGMPAGSARSPVQITLRERESGFTFTVVNLHGKSPIGNEAENIVIRRAMHAALVANLQSQNIEHPIIIGCDGNFPLDDPSRAEREPFDQAGYVLVDDGKKTYRYLEEPPKKIDGFWVKDLHNFTAWTPDLPEFGSEEAFAYSGFSDHLPTFVTFSVPDVTSRLLTMRSRVTRVASELALVKDACQTIVLQEGDTVNLQAVEQALAGVGELSAQVELLQTALRNLRGYRKS